MCISSHRDGWSAATGCRLLPACRGGCGVCRNEKRLHVGPETAAAGRMWGQKDLQTSNVYGLDTPPCFRMPCQHFTRPPPPPPQTGGDLRKLLGVATLRQERMPPFFPHKCERHEDVDRNHLSPFIQPLLLPVRRPIHSRCFGRNSDRAAGFAEVDAFWRQTHSWLALPPRCICDPVASSCAVFDELCCPARPDSACCASSRAAPLADLHWPLPLGQWQGWLGAYLHGNVGQVPSSPSPDGSLPSGEPEVRKRAHVDGVLLVLPLIVLEVSAGSPAGG